MNEPVNLTNCDREPIHTPGSIQPHGAMLICDPDTDMVVHASANAAAFLNLDFDPIGRPLSQIIGDQSSHDLRNAAAKAGGAQIAGALRGRRLPTVARFLDITIHNHDCLFIVEFEDCVDSDGRFEDPLDMTQSAVRRIALESSIKGIVSTGARIVRAMLKFDRVMVYHFQHNGAGRVIAEAKSASAHSFLNQFFPATDIPAQARRLYLENWIRSIVDVNYEPIPVLPAPVGAPIDMSHAHLRSVSPIHCEYLRNIGAAGSMSISIVVDGKLWGLIACHHDSAKHVPLSHRLGAELFGQYFSLQIASADRRAQFMTATRARERLDAIINALTPDEPMRDILLGRLKEFASLIPSDGAGLWLSGEWTTTGHAPPRDRIAALMEYIVRRAKGGIWSTHELRAEDNGQFEFGANVAGLLVVPLSSAGKDFLVFFRSEESYQIEWAGQPDKVVVRGIHGDRLTPRGSFETWREDVRGQAHPWTDADRVVAESIRTYLRDVVLRYTEATEEERERAEKRRRLLNDELNHRVKNIIALVKSIALQTGATAKTVEDYSRSLEGRLRALAFAHDQSLSGIGGDLLTLMEAEASLHRYGERPDRVVVEGPPIGLNDRAFGVVALLMHEMMTNAAKYGGLSTPGGKLTISWRLTSTGDCELDWIETGGPVVTAPDMTGFGSKLIRTSIEYDLGGTVLIDYRPTGLVGHFVLPARHVSAPTNTPVITTMTGVVAPDPLMGLNVLLVEDNAIIAMDADDALRKLGATTVASYPTVKAALKAIGTAKPDFAVLDFNLDGETAGAVASELGRLNVPFLFVTGYGDVDSIPEQFRQVPILRKPISERALAEKVGQTAVERRI